MLAEAFNEKRRLILGLTLLLCVGFAATSLVSYFVSRNAIRHQIIANELPLTTDNVYSEIQKDLIRPIFISSMMANDTFLRDWVLDGEHDAAKITKYLHEVQQKYGAASSFFVSERSRVYYHESGILKTVSERDPYDAWYFRTRKMKELYEINPDADEAHDYALTIFVNYRAVDYQGNLIGVTGVGLPVENIKQLVDRYQQRYNRTVYLADKQGRIILHATQFPSTIKNIHEIAGLGKQARTILGKEEGKYQYHQGNSVHQLNVRFIPELNLYLFVEKPEDEDFVGIRHTLFLNLSICAAITAIVALLAGISVNRHQARLKQAVESHTEELHAALAETHAAIQAQNRMLAYISHDLRTPLASIVHYTQLLSVDPGGQASHYQATIEQSVAHQLELIDELMEYTRGELEHLKLLPAPTFLHAFLHQVASQGELLAAHQHNRFGMLLDDAMPPVIVIDVKRLRQVLINLLSNASKFTAGGDIRLQVEIQKNEAQHDARLCFSVTDTGSGMTEDDRQGIFMPYERRKPDRPGFGLGLAIADQIVRKMGSELRVESVLGQGSRFWFDIALETANESDVLQPAQAFPIPEPFGTGKRILIVDANPTIRDYLCEILSLADFDVDYSDTPEDAQRQCAASLPDAVLVSQTAHQQNAWELLRAIHALRPADAPPVVLYSAAPPRRPHAFPEGVDFAASLLKPVSADRLLQTLQALAG